MECEELIDVVCVLEQKFGLHINVLKEGDNGVLEIFVHLTADLSLSSRYNLVIMLYSQHQVTHPINRYFVRIQLKLGNHR